MNLAKYSLLFAFTLFSALAHTQPLIDTLAGTGEASYGGNNGPAAEAMLDSPEGIAVDAAGRVYFNDVGNRRVRRIDTDGTITTLIGMDDGLAQDVALSSHLAGIAVDSRGHVYIADSSNNRLVRFDPTDNSTQLIGTGRPGFNGDGGLATAAEFHSPRGLTIDAQDNIYVADSNNQRIRRIDANGMINTIAGTGESGFGGDEGLATGAQFRTPVGVAVDSQGNVYVADSGSRRIRRIGADGIITTIAGTGRSREAGDGGAARDASFGSPTGIATDSAGNVYFSVYNQHKVRRIGLDGTISSFAGSGRAGFGGDSGPAAAGRLQNPYGIAVDQAGNLYIADLGNHRIRKVFQPLNATRAAFTISPSNGVAPLQVTLDASSSQLPDGVNAEEYRWKISGQTTTSDSPQAETTFKQPGNYVIGLEILDSRGQTASVERALTVDAPTAAPGELAANFTITPETGQAPLQATLDASSSQAAPGRRIVEYHWKIGTASGKLPRPTAKVNFRSNGRYNIQLTVTDDQGQQASARHLLTLSDAPVEPPPTPVTPPPTEPPPTDDGYPALGQGIQVPPSGDMNSATTLDDAVFKGGVEASGEFLAADTVIRDRDITVKARIQPAQVHLGERADIIVALAYQPSKDAATQLYFQIAEAIALPFLPTKSRFLPWNGEIASLTPVQTAVELTQTVDIEIFQGVPTAGIYQFEFGYRLPNGAWVFNGERRLEFSVER